MRAHWLTDDSIIVETRAPRDPRGNISGEAIDEATLAQNGVLYRRLSVVPAEHQQALDELRTTRGYVTQDEVELSPATENLDAICAKFVPEHDHDDDEVRFVLEGSGVFDIRSVDNRLMHVVVEAGDLIVVPKERWHRFMLTEEKHIRCVRLFRDKSGWVPRYRAPVAATAAVRS